MKKLIYASLILFGSLNAVEDREEPNAIENLEGEPSIFVHGVNVINGDFVDSHADLVIPGVEPFVLQRSYHKLEKQKGSLGKSWNLNFDSSLKVTYEDEGVDGVIEHNGGRLAFKTSNTYPNIEIVDLDPHYLTKAVTNTSSGYKNGRTNIKNIKMIWSNHPQK